MSTTKPALEAQLRSFFRSFNRFMLAMWQIGLGPAINCWPSVGGQIMVLTTVGRKSGQPRRTPLNYAIIGDEIYCLAGFGGISDWYRNLCANPYVEVWLPEGWWAGEAEEITGGERRLDLLRAVLRASGFAAPLAGINPRRISDAALDTATATYKLVRIRRTRERTGEGGPGQYAGIWPWLAHALGLAVLLLLLRQRRLAR